MFWSILRWLIHEVKIEREYSMGNQWTNVSQRKENAPAHGVSETVVGVLGGGQLGRMLC